MFPPLQNFTTSMLENAQSLLDADKHSFSAFRPLSVVFKKQNAGKKASFLANEEISSVQFITRRRSAGFIVVFLTFAVRVSCHYRLRGPAVFEGSSLNLFNLVFVHASIQALSFMPCHQVVTR